MAADEKRIPGADDPRDAAGGLGSVVVKLRRVFGGSRPEAPTPPRDPAEAKAREDILEQTRLVPKSARPTSDLALLDTLLARLAREPNSADAVLRELGTTFFPIENGWRSLFTRLIQQGDTQPELKRLALEDYRRYVARRDAERTTGAAPAASSIRPPPASGTQGMAGAGEAPAPHLIRLPAGRPVAVRSPDEHRPFECRLASCVAWVRSGAHPLFAVPDHGSFALRDGRNLIGREPSGDIVIEAHWRDVSRRHLMIEVTGLGRLMLTDHSTYGTFVSRDAIDEAM